MATILVVDDNEAIRRLVSKILHREGYAVEEAVDGVDAISKLEERPFDAVVLDLMMPRATGFDVIARLKQDNPELLKTVVVLTAAMSKISDEELRSVGRVVAKPFELDNLVTTIRSCLNSTRA